MTLKVAGGVYTGGGRVATVHVVLALVDVHALHVVGRLAAVARLAAAVVPAGHVYAQRVVVAPVQPRRALVQVLLAGRANEAHAARAHVRSHALAAVQASVFAHSWKEEEEDAWEEPLKVAKREKIRLDSRSQENPSPEYPSLQRHWNEPGVLTQSAFSWQVCCPVSHSLISTQLNLSSLRYPGKHSHLYEPNVFSQRVFEWQWFPDVPPF